MSRVTKGNNSITKKYNILTHKGVDIGWSPTEANNTIIAHTDGTIVDLVKTYTKTDKKGNSYGNYIKIKHPNGYYTLYAHLKYGSVNVRKGEKVKQGQAIAIMGATGHCTARHLHFEVRNTKDNRINPTDYLYKDLPSMSKEVKYQTYDNVKNKWLPKVKSGNNDYAGNLGNAMSGLRITSLKYRTYDLVKKKWLPYVTGDVSYAGNLTNNVGGIEIKNAEFEVHTRGGSWIKSENGVSYPNKPIDGIRINKVN